MCTTDLDFDLIGWFLLPLGTSTSFTSALLPPPPPVLPLWTILWSCTHLWEREKDDHNVSYLYMYILVTSYRSLCRVGTGAIMTVCVCRYLYTSSSLVWVSSGSGEGEDFTECAVRSTWSTRHDNARIMQWASGLEYRQIDSGTLEVVDSRCSSLHTDHRTSLAQFSVLLEQSQHLTRVYQRGNTLQWVVGPLS